MKRLSIQYLVLVAATVAAYLTARAGHLALALLPLVSYAATLVWILYKDQVKRRLFDAVTYCHVKELIKDNQRLGEALISVAEATPSVVLRQGEVYTIDLPDQDKLVLYRRTAEEDEKEG